MGASESKLAFKEDVFRLAREDNISADSQWWAQFYRLPESSDDVFALWSPNDLHNLTNNGADRPPPGTQTSPKKNLETLVYTCIARLHALQTKRCFTDPHHPIAPEALNCIRILTRLLPYIYEADHLTVWEDQFFWKPRKPQQMWNIKQNKPGEPFDGLNPSKKYGEDAAEQEIRPPLGEQLIDILVRYMFFPNFTLPKKLDQDELPLLKPQYNIWQSGIGCRQSVGMTKENEKNAVEVTRLLLAISSRQLYIQPHIVAETGTKALTYLTTQCDRQVSLSLICSLLNTVLKYNPATWRVPIEFSVDGDSRIRLVTLSLQLLLVLVLYTVPNAETNGFRKAISRLHRVEDFQFIQQGLTLVLTQPVSGVSTYLPGKQKMTPWAPEMLILFWELLQVNKRFRSFIIETDRAHDFVVLVLYYAMDAKNEPTKQGIVRMCVLILQTLSVEPAFGSRLNKPFIGQESLPSTLKINNFHGSYADFLITSVHTLMTTTQGRLESMYPALLAIVNNIAPYAQDLQRATSSRLLDLFASLSSPRYLLEKEGNYAILVSLLQAMNAILEHQYESNRRFIEVVVRSRKRFKALRDFTVEGAVAELDRQAQERKDRASGIIEPAGVRSPARGGSIDSIRSPTSVRSPHLGNVPEHGAFAIGDDEDEDEDGDGNASMTFSAPLSASTSAVDDAVPMQSRSMSEKARGKQPVGQGSFSRTTSRNTSNTSLPSLITAPSANGFSSQQSFVPTAAWLETWLPHLPLHTILTVLDQNGRSIAQGFDSTALPTPAAKQPGEGIKAGEDQSTSVSASPTTATAAEHPHPEVAVADVASPFEPQEIKVQAFQWTTLSLGWYLSLLWGLVYASDVATNRGVNGIWTGTAIKLFNIKASLNGGISLTSPKGAVDAVGNTIVQRLGSLSFNSNSSPTVREV